MCVSARRFDWWRRRLRVFPVCDPEPGSVFGLIGPNGAGKTTAFDLIFGMGKNDAGTIRVLGLDHRAGEITLKQRAAYVSPDLNFQVWGKVGKAVEEFLGGKIQPNLAEMAKAVQRHLEESASA